MQGVQVIDSGLLDRLVAKAESSPRKRINYNFHTQPEDNPNRLLNAMLRGTYVRPHRHRDPPKPESFVVLRGRLAVFVFDDAGAILECHRLGLHPGGTMGVDLEPGIFHSLVVLSEHAVIFEVKPGPYIAATDKEFAAWAPDEHTEAAQAYVAKLQGHVESL